MPRVTAVHRPGDYPGTPDEATRADLATLFAHLRPGDPDPEIDGAHAGLAIAAQNPLLALNLAKLSAVIAGQLPWCARTDLRELAIQVVNHHYKSDYSFETRKAGAARAGISVAQQDALGEWQTSPLFDEEQRLVIDYANAVVTGDVPAALFARVVAAHGEKGAVEMTSVISFFAFWAMFLNATGAGA